MVDISALDGFLWWAFALVALLFFQRALHREIQVTILIISRSYEAMVYGFALIFLPGVFLHELSHFLTARLLGVRTGRFSIFPRPMPGGRLMMGYVEVERSDYLRDSLIGVAPVIFGSLFVAYVAMYQLHLPVMWDVLRNAQWDLFWMGVSLLPGIPYFWVWCYLTFVISSMMLPSESDRTSWGPLALILAVLFGWSFLAGIGPWALEHLTPPLNEFFRGSALILLVSVVLHLFFLLPFALLHRVLARMTGMDVD